MGALPCRCVAAECPLGHTQATQPALTELSIRNNGAWGSDALEAVAHAVGALPDLRRVWAGRERGGDAWPAAAVALGGSTATATAAVEALACALRGTSSLAVLSLEGRDLGEAGEAALASALESNCSLTEVFLGEVVPLRGVSGAALRRRHQHRAAIRRCGPARTCIAAALSLSMRNACPPSRQSCSEKATPFG